MNENQPHASNITANTISNTVNETGFNFEKYDPYVDVLRTLFVPSIDKRICELLELFHTDKTTIDTPSYWERCLNIVSTIKYEVGVVQSYLKQASSYLVNSRVVNFLTNTLVLSNRLDKVCRDLDSLGEKNLLRYANAWNFVNEKSYWRVARQSVSITPEGKHRASLVEAEIGSTSSAYPTSNSNSGSSPRRFRKFSKHSSKSRKSNSENNSGSCSSFAVQSAEFSSNNNNNNNDGEKKLKVLIGDPHSSKYSEVRKSPVPCKCENLIKHFIKTDLIDSPASVKAKNKLEKALRDTCCSLNEILEPMDGNNVQKCQLLCKFKENYVKIQLKKQENYGNKSCLFTERIDVSKKDFAALKNPSFELEDISEEISKNSKAKSDENYLMENDSKNFESNLANNNNGLSKKNDSTIQKRSLVVTKDSFDLNESDLRDSKVNASSSRIYNTGIPKKRNKCLDPKHCGKSQGELCRCPGLCFCELDSFDDDYTTAKTSVRSWRSSVKCNSEHSCDCSSGSSIGSVVGKNKNCCSGGNCDDDKNGCGSKSSSIDIYISVNENDSSRQILDSKSISVQTIEEKLELRPAESEKKSEDSASIFPVNSSVFEALKTIDEVACGCDEKIEACDEKPLIDFEDSFEENESGNNSCDYEGNSLKDLPKNESINCISEGFVKNMVDKFEVNNLDSKEMILIEKNEAVCSVALQDVKIERIESNFGDAKHENDCGCSVGSDSLKEIKAERKESSSKNQNLKENDDCNCTSCSGSSQEIKPEIQEPIFTNQKHEDNCNCSSCSISSQEIKPERPKSSFEDKKHGNDCNCSSCSISSQEMKPERPKSSFEDKKHGNDCNCSSCSISSQEMKPESPKSNSEDKKHGNDCCCSVCSVSVQEVKLEVRKLFEEERIEENELKKEKNCSIGSFQEEIHELAKRKSGISEEVVEEIKAPVKLQTDEKDEVIEGCGCTIDSEDIFTSAQSVLQKSAVEIELSKDRSSLSPIVEMEFREVDILELKPRTLSLDSGKVKTGVEEKSIAEESEKRKSSLQKKSEVPKIVTSESSASEIPRSITTDVSKISRTFSRAEANCRRPNYYSHICVHKFYRCACLEAYRFSKFKASKKNQNYRSINADKLQRPTYKLPMYVREIILSACRDVRLVFSKEGCQKMGQAFREIIRRILKKRNKATSTEDLPLYNYHHHPRKNRRAVSKFSLNSRELSYENLYPAHKRAQNLYRKNNEKVPREFLRSTKQNKEVINQTKQLHRPKNSQKLNSCFTGSNCNCNCECYNYKLKKYFSNNFFSTFSVDNLGENGSGDSNSRCDLNYSKKMRKIAAMRLIDYLETLPSDK
ncbi:hypothetical protein KQX54_004207 [Cotesia glomerata]|uniref:Uncharacterized protein n=1 Tax=Cotesia glomerata TaxID=32391 RepID=A0AAV7HXL4_COTGL|nr:hypothetical protein KQX54_004207 [Cotesia glomerata]